MATFTTVLEIITKAPPVLVSQQAFDEQQLLSSSDLLLNSFQTSFQRRMFIGLVMTHENPVGGKSTQLWSHRIKTQKFGENLLFLATNDCDGIRKARKNRGSPEFTDEFRELMRRFLNKLEKKYGFYAEHYLERVSETDYMRLKGVRDYLDYVKAEKGVELLKLGDELYMKALVTYVFIQRTYAQDPE